MRIKKEIEALSLKAQIIADIPYGEKVLDEINVRKITEKIKQDKRLVDEIAEKYAREAIKILKKDFTHHGIKQVVERGKKDGFNILDVIYVKSNGEYIGQHYNEVAVIGKSRGIPLTLRLSVEDKKIKTV
ncbi:MAG: hypothetical protein ACE5J9_11485, partial [Methanosarcinales archaeon]